MCTVYSSRLFLHYYGFQILYFKMRIINNKKLFGILQKLVSQLFYFSFNSLSAHNWFEKKSLTAWSKRRIYFKNRNVSKTQKCLKKKRRNTPTCQLFHQINKTNQTVHFKTALPFSTVIFDLDWNEKKLRKDGIKRKQGLQYSSYLSRWWLFPFIYNFFSFFSKLFMFVIVREPTAQITTNTKSRRNPLLVLFFPEPIMLVSRLSTLAGKPVEAGHPFFLKVGVWTGRGVLSTVWIRGQERKQRSWNTPSISNISKNKSK